MPSTPLVWRPYFPITFQLWLKQSIELKNDFELEYKQLDIIFLFVNLKNTRRNFFLWQLSAKKLKFEGRGKEWHVAFWIVGKASRSNNFQSLVIKLQKAESFTPLLKATVRIGYIRIKAKPKTSFLRNMWRFRKFNARVFLGKKL